MPLCNYLMLGEGSIVFKVLPKWFFRLDLISPWDEQSVNLLGKHI